MPHFIAHDGLQCVNIFIFMKGGRGKISVLVKLGNTACNARIIF